MTDRRAVHRDTPERRRLCVLCSGRIERDREAPDCLPCARRVVEDAIQREIREAIGGAA